MEITPGYRYIEAPDAGPPVPVRFLYPATAPVRTEAFGPYTMEVATDAPVVGAGLPLVVVSHGTGGTSLSHRGLGVQLARAGFVVALVDHPGNNRADNSLAFTAQNLENRPRHIRAVLDYAFADPELGPRLAPGVAGMVGHSMGGYTALAVAGGKATAFPRETTDGQALALPPATDGRVRALVLLAPAAAWFLAEGALAEVNAPLLLMTAEHDAFAPAEHAEIIKSRIGDPSLIDHRVIAGAGHFSFQSPFPAAMCRPDFLPSQDPPGFDRAAFNDVMNGDVESFLRATLGAGAFP